MFPDLGYHITFIQSKKILLIESLIPLVDALHVFPHDNNQSTTWQLYFGNVRFTLSLSRDFWRGFSGEGAALLSRVSRVLGVKDLLSHGDTLLSRFVEIRNFFDCGGNFVQDPKIISTVILRILS